MQIVVIVPCRDRQKSLDRCLSSIARTIDATVVKYGSSIKIRTLIVNDRSGDEFVRMLTSDFPWAEIVDADGAGPGAARNTGCKRADADLYLLTDSDCVVAEDWCLRALDWHRGRRSPMAQGVPWLYQQVQNPRLGACEENLYRHMFACYIEGATTSMIDPRCMMISREYFDRFPRDIFATWITDASYEDRAVIGALLEKGLQVEWRPEAQVYHEDPADNESSWKQKYRHGAGRIYRWSEPPAFEFLLSRYFLAPLGVGIERTYVIPAHIAFLLGYRDAYRRKSPHSHDWWVRFTEALSAVAHDAPTWIQQVERVVSLPETANSRPALRAIGAKIEGMHSAETRVSWTGR